MRTALTAAAVPFLSLSLALAGAVPAAADGPAVAAVTVSGLVSGVSLTCDTSAYPAPFYPCDFAAHVTDGCSAVTVTPLATACTLSIEGTLRATPHPSATGRCTITAWEDLLVTFRSNADPSFHVAQEEVATVLPEAGVHVHGGGVQSGFTVTVVAPYRVGEIPPNPIAGSVATNVVFSDLQHDCRNRFGGDPSFDPSASGRGPTGSLTVVRPA